MEINSGLSGYCFRALYFCTVFLSVAESNGAHRLEMFQCPEQAGSGVLSSTEYHQGAIALYYWFHIISL